MDETLSIQEWADVLQKMSLAGYKVTQEEVTKMTNLELDEAVEPEKTEPTEMNNVMNLYKDYLNG